MKRFGRYATAAMVMCCMVAGAEPSTTADAVQGLRISDGKLYRGKDLVVDGFSISRTGTGYIFVYIPEFGLITLSARKFPGADATGTFEGSRIRFTAGKERFELTTSTAIIATDSRPAWVAVDRAFSLRDKAAMVAYGDSPGMPYHWPMYRSDGVNNR